jgi:hypothetical protein
MTTNNLPVTPEAQALANEYGWNAPHRKSIAQAFQRAMNQAAEAAARDLWTPNKELWGGLARDLVMWLDMTPKTPRALFKHLERCGREIPQWLRDEPEMQHLDHVPSKGTRAVLIYRAMLPAIRTLPTEGEGD